LTRVVEGLGDIGLGDLEAALSSHMIGKEFSVL
jgi:hypothetical protein